MDRRLFLLVVGIALSIVLKPIFITAQQSAGQQKGKTSPNQTKAQPNTNSANTPIQQPQNVPLTIQGDVRVTNQDTPEGEAKEKAAEMKSNVTLGIAIIGLAFAVAAWYQSRRQADAAEKQVGLVRDQFAHINRAYLDFEWIGRIHDEGVPNQPAAIVEYRIHNFGNTPARIISLGFSSPARPVINDEISIFPGREHANTIEIQLASFSPCQILGQLLYSDGFTTRLRHFDYTAYRTGTKDLEIRKSGYGDNNEE